MESSGIADAIRTEKGNLRYEYFQPINDQETVLLIDSLFFKVKRNTAETICNIPLTNEGMMAQNPIKQYIILKKRPVPKID